MSKRGTYYVAYNDTENEWWVMRRNIGVGMCINKENCQVFADRLNALERDNAELNAELTETLMAVADLMDENADLIRQLAGSKAYASRREIELGRVLLERFHLRRQLAEAYERVAKMADEWAQTEIAAGTDKGYAQIMEVFAEEVRSLILPKEADRG